MSQENIETVRMAMEKFVGEGPRASFAGLVRDDVELRPAFEVTGGATFVGTDGVARFMEQWTEDFDDWTLVIEDVIDAGEAVVARMHQSARGKGSGALVELVFGAVFRLREGEVERIEMYTNFGEALVPADLSA